MFTLCFKCSEDENQLELWKHEDSERALTGEWVSLEVYKAISKDYTFVKIHEVWHCDQLNYIIQLQNAEVFLHHILTWH